MSEDKDMAQINVERRTLLAKYSEFFRRGAQWNQDRDHKPRSSKPAPSVIAAATPPTDTCRRNGLKKEDISKLIDVHYDIAQWYLLEFFRQIGGLDEEQFKLWENFENKYGVDFPREYTQQPLLGDIRTTFEPNFWFLQGKIQILMWLLGGGLSEIVYDDWDRCVPRDLREKLREEVKAIVKRKA